MLRIEVYVNRRRIAVADALNVRGEIVSDYLCSAVSEANPFSGADRRTDGFEIKRHRRAQSVWALVAKMAGRLAENDRQRDAYLVSKADTPSLPTGGGDDRGVG